MTVIAKSKLDLRKYARLVARAVPLVIENDAELKRVDAEVGRLLKKGYDKLTLEECRLLTLLTKLIEDYEDLTFEVPDAPPHEMLQTLIELNDLRQADLVPIFGTRSRVSEAVNGKRAISKAQAKALGDRFKVAPDLFF
jgi:HTH-type transcriptional regulator/antitoxin HigA